MAQDQEIALSIGAGINQMPFIAACRERGYAVAAIDRDLQAPGFEHCDHWAPIPARDAIVPLLNWLRTLPRQPTLVGCFSFGSALATREAVAHELGLPCLPPAAEWMIQGKSEQLQALTRLGLARRQWWPAQPQLDARRRYLVKSGNGGGSSGIALRHGDELIGQPPASLIEEYVDGREFRLQVWVRDGQIAWLAQLERRNWADTLCLARLAPVQPAVGWAYEVAQTLVDACGLREALLKIDVIRGDDQTEVIEVDPGIAGDHLEDGVGAAFYGIDPAAAYLDLLTGAPTSFSESSATDLAFDYIYHPRPGSRRRCQRLLEQALADVLPGSRCVAHGRDGHSVHGPPTSNGDALCGVLRLARGPLPEDLSLAIARRLDAVEEPS